MDPSTSGLPFAGPFDWEFEQALRSLSYKSSPTRQQAIHRPHRVFKVTSTGNSPKKTSARRSTLSFDYNPSRTPIGNPPQPYNDLVTTEQRTLPAFPRARPTSWHPSSRMAPAIVTLPPPTSYFPKPDRLSDSSFLQPFMTTQINGLITPLSQPCYDEPLEQEDFSALDDAHPYEDPYAFLDEFRGTPDYSSSPPYTETHINYHSDQPCQPQPASPQHRMDTAPPSPNSTSTSPPKSGPPQLLCKIESATEELVGMGIYDPPSPYAFRALNAPQDCSTTLGKGLKLEETFEPPPPEETAEEDGDHEMEEDMGEVGYEKLSETGGAHGTEYDSADTQDTDTSARLL